MTTQNQPKCPPCYGDCRQGRRCTAEPAPVIEPDDDFGEDLSRVEKVQVGCAITFALCVLAGVIVLLLRGCSA